MTACPSPDSYGPPPLCGATTIPYDPSTTLAVTGFDLAPMLLTIASIVIIAGFLVFVLAGTSKQELIEDYKAERARRLDAEADLAAERRHIVALETYVPGEKNADAWPRVSPGFETTKEAHEWLAKVSHPDDDLALDEFELTEDQS